MEPLCVCPINKNYIEILNVAYSLNIEGRQTEDADEVLGN
jgi:hypothetical protein